MVRIENVLQECRRGNLSNGSQSAAKARRTFPLVLEDVLCLHYALFQTTLPTTATIQSKFCALNYRANFLILPIAKCFLARYDEVNRHSRLRWRFRHSKISLKVRTIKRFCVKPRISKRRENSQTIYRLLTQPIFEHTDSSRSFVHFCGGWRIAPKEKHYDGLRLIATRKTLQPICTKVVLQETQSISAGTVFLITFGSRRTIRLNVLFFRPALSRSKLQREKSHNFEITKLLQINGANQFSENLLEKALLKVWRRSTDPMDMISENFKVFNWALSQLLSCSVQ